MSKGSAPPAPDYTGAAQATAQGNLQNLNQQTWANRPTQNTPWGSSTWTNQTDTASYDQAVKNWVASGSDPKSRPDANSYTTWTNNVTLSPAEQAAFNSQQQIKQNQSSLAQTMQGQVASQMQNGFVAPSMDSYTNGLPAIKANFGGFNPSGVGSIDQSQINPASYTSPYKGIDQSFASSSPALQNSAGQSSGVNLSAPQFDQSTADAGTQAAYKASTGLLADQWSQDNKNLDANLRLQGLTPGTEAYNNAMQNQLRVQAQQKDQLANQAVSTGNQIANNNYQSALAGYQAGNAAQNQDFSQHYSNAQLNNAASGQKFGQDLQAFNANNSASSQALQNGLSQYAAALQGQSAYNSAAGQSYNQALATHGANQQALQDSNAAQAQAYQQAMQQYQTAYQNAYQNYLQPLNSMNAVLTGQQVGMPQMPGFTAAGYTPGADYSGAASATGQYNSGVYAQNSANASSTMGTIGSVAAAAAIAF